MGYIFLGRERAIRKIGENGEGDVGWLVGWIRTSRFCLSVCLFDTLISLDLFIFVRLL